MVPIFAAIWIAGIVRLVIALVRQEAVGAELVLVFLTVVIIPLVLLSPRLARRW
jgi:hypothetical protein